MRIAKLFALLFASLLPMAGLAESPPRSFAYVLQADALAKTKSEAVKLLSGCQRDWIVLDADFSGDTPWELADIRAIRGGQADRKVIAYTSIGEAEDYRKYWRNEWINNGKLSTSAPAWLGQENPDWKGNFRVKYWHAEWQKIILTSIDDALSRGFDGVYLDIVDGFETFEKEGADFIDDRINPETKQSYRRDMVDWVKTIAARARAKNPTALVIPQNGSQLSAHSDLLEVISAIGIEDLFTNGNKLQPKAHTNEVLSHLKKLATANKPVLLIEYPKSAERQTMAKKLAVANGFVWLLTDRALKTLGESGN
ncbi:MJ1477/TM1410 family putative glycoside hydrolase [Anatilimnocola floriformis]|uniref:MJ1477/TM1410 family putative glycoside hydrolase n=1 Tax=Anatilimnocola floriformis TaxID=2948575 RepID=UPI0020C59609|nr:MJ1477/TM1410 family putative glycoside hydrolase [Anatilimnocola floriformis]